MEPKTTTSAYLEELNDIDKVPAAESRMPINFLLIFFSQISPIAVFDREETVFNIMQDRCKIPNNFVIKRTTDRNVPSAVFAQHRSHIMPSHPLTSNHTKSHRIISCRTIPRNRSAAIGDDVEGPLPECCNSHRVQGLQLSKTSFGTVPFLFEKLKSVLQDE